ncbi:MAG: exonuclease SbcCD subunit D [Lachnospiraceae bacterium]|nr:exonuclease SbcCD subunit D [Lachnospiraceae bacterium]
MRFIHISDLHLGKKVYEYSMLEEQKNALWQVLAAVDEEKVDGIFIAGDIYDKSIPTIEAMEVFDSFLVELSTRNIDVFIISGNHDSSERVGFGAEFFKSKRIYISKAYEGKIQYVDKEDTYGNVRIHLIPFLKPANVRRFHQEAEINDYNSAIRTVVDNMELCKEGRNIVLVHQFITGAVRSQSEESFLGGMDNIEYDLFDEFDYVALGHIHKAQAMGRQQVRYSGALVKYALDEINHVKSMTLVEIKNKGEVETRMIPIKPIHDMRCIEGTYMELTDRKNYIDTKVDDYLHVVLKDEEDVPDALRKLRVIYPNILKLEYDNTRTRQINSVLDRKAIKNKEPIEYIEELYKIQNNENMSKEQALMLQRIMEDSNETN